MPKNWCCVSGFYTGYVTVWHDGCRGCQPHFCDFIDFDFLVFMYEFQQFPKEPQQKQLHISIKNNFTQSVLLSC